MVHCKDHLLKYKTQRWTKNTLERKLILHTNPSFPESVWIKIHCFLCKRIRLRIFISYSKRYNRTKFFAPASADCFYIHWNLRDSKSLQINWTLLSILADLNNAEFWMVSTRPLIFKFSSPRISPSVNVPSAPISIGITITFMFHSFF